MLVPAPCDLYDQSLSDFSMFARIWASTSLTSAVDSAMDSPVSGWLDRQRDD